MSIEIDSAQINPPISNPDEKSKGEGVWSALLSFVSLIRARFYVFVSRIKALPSQVKNFILCRKDVSDTKYGMLDQDESVVKDVQDVSDTEPGGLDQDVNYMRECWINKRAELNGIIESLRTIGTDRNVDGETQLFDLTFFGDNDWTKRIYLLSPDHLLSHVIDMLKHKASLIDRKLGLVEIKAGEEPSKLEPFSDKAKMNMHLSLESMGKTIFLFEEAIKARQTGNPKSAIYYEMAFLAEILSISLHFHTTVEVIYPYDDKGPRYEQESLMYKPTSVIIKLMNEITRSMSSMDDNEKLKIEQSLIPEVRDKCKDLFQLFDMFANGRLSLIKKDSSGKDDDRFQIALGRIYPEWRLGPGYRLSSELLFLRLLANTECLALEDTKDMEICIEYVQRLDKAKRLFYQEKSEVEALKMAKEILEDAFALELSPDDIRLDERKAYEDMRAQSLKK